MVERLLGELERVKAQVRRLEAKSAGAVARAVSGDVDTSGGLPKATFAMRADEERGGVEVLEQYGFTSAPPAGAEGVALAVGGDGSHHVVLGLGNRSLRLTGLASGEVALYSEHGQQVVLKASGDIVVVPDTGGNVYLGQDGATKKVALVDEVNDLRSAFNGHTHPTAPVGPVSTPTVVPGIVPVPLFTGSDNVFAKKT
jgi:phage baseplate assembly protein V